VEAVDATGCGDAFAAALLCRLVAAGACARRGKTEWAGSLDTESLAASVLYANAAGALTATKKGVIPSLPRAREVDSFLQDKPGN
jgi:fructokinase